MAPLRGAIGSDKALEHVKTTYSIKRNAINQIKQALRRSLSDPLCAERVGMQEESIRLWFPMAIFVAMPLLISILPAQLFRCKGKYIFLLAVCFLLGLVITSNAYHVRNAYLGLPHPWSWGIFIFGLIWSLSFYIPSWVLMASLSGRAKQELRYDLLKGFLGSLGSVVLIAVPSIFLIVLFSLE